MTKPSEKGKEKITSKKKSLWKLLKELWQHHSKMCSGRYCEQCEKETDKLYTYIFIEGGVLLCRICYIKAIYPSKYNAVTQDKGKP